MRIDQNIVSDEEYKKYTGWCKMEFVRCNPDFETLVNKIYKREGLDPKIAEYTSNFDLKDAEDVVIKTIERYRFDFWMMHKFSDGQVVNPILTKVTFFVDNEPAAGKTKEGNDYAIKLNKSGSWDDKDENAYQALKGEMELIKFLRTLCNSKKDSEMTLRDAKGKFNFTKIVEWINKDIRRDKNGHKAWVRLYLNKKYQSAWNEIQRGFIGAEDLIKGGTGEYQGQTKVFDSPETKFLNWFKAKKKENQDVMILGTPWFEEFIGSAKPESNNNQTETKSQPDEDFEEAQSDLPF